MSEVMPLHYWEDASLPGLVFRNERSLELAKELAAMSPGNYLITGGPIAGKTHLVRTLFPDALILPFPRKLSSEGDIWRSIEPGRVMCYDDADFYWWKPKQWNALRKFLDTKTLRFRPKGKRETIEIELPRVRIITSRRPLNGIPQDVLERFRVIAPMPGKLPWDR